MLGGGAVGLRRVGDGGARNDDDATSGSGSSTAAAVAEIADAAAAGAEVERGAGACAAGAEVDAEIDGDRDVVAIDAASGAEIDGDRDVVAIDAAGGAEVERGADVVDACAAGAEVDAEIDGDGDVVVTDAAGGAEVDGDGDVVAIAAAAGAGSSASGSRSSVSGSRVSGSGSGAGAGAGRARSEITGGDGGVGCRTRLAAGVDASEVTATDLSWMRASAGAFEGLAFGGGVRICSVSSASRVFVLAPGGRRGSRPRSIGFVESPTSLGFARGVVAVRGFGVAITSPAIGGARSNGFVTSPAPGSLAGGGDFAVMLGSGFALALGVAG